jgi:hypothetical protein
MREMRTVWKKWENQEGRGFLEDTDVDGIIM